MYLGQCVLIKHNGKIIEGNIENIYYEDLDIKLTNGEIIKRKFWEIRIIKEK